jgi:hypothetical protein
MHANDFKLLFAEGPVITFALAASMRPWPESCALKNKAELR